jgi:orotidine-5'-phosphate decarboxylase
MTHNPLIIALDVNDAAQARAIVNTLGDSVDFYKVGLELYAAEGIAFARELVDRGKNVFLDLKLYDIGETVKRAVSVVARSGVRFLTVHGSKALLKAAIEGRGDADLKLLAITVLTSFNEQDLADLGYETSVGALVELLARAAVDCGVEGVVCSPLEAARVRPILPPNMVLVTPGVRSKTAGAGDQKRIATPAEAIAAGADYLVIGRQVTRATNPQAEVEKITAEIESATAPIYG